MTTDQLTHNAENPKAFQLPLNGKRGDRRVIIAWTSVQDDEFSRTVLTKHSWCLQGNGYACRGTPKIWLHRFIFERYYEPIPTGMLVDHIDRNRLNNLPTNLRLASKSINAANGRKRSTNTSGFVGVYWAKGSNKWAAHITVDLTSIHLGIFISARAAADAVNEAYQKYFPGVQIPNP